VGSGYDADMGEAHLVKKVASGQTTVYAGQLSERYKTTGQVTHCYFTAGG
jgi:hypothetical protein